MAYIEFPLQFSRQYAAPLDVSSVMTSAEKSSYLSNPVRYAGQVVYDSDTQKLYVLSSDKSEWLEVGSSSTGVSNLQTDLNALTSRVATIEGLTATSGTGQEGDFVMLGANGKIADEYLPALAITTTHVVSSYSQVLSLSSSVQEGDVAVVNDTVEGGLLSKSYIYTGTSWVELKTPLDSKISSLSSDLQSAISNLKTSGVDSLSTAFATLTAGNETGGSVSVLGSIASQNYDAVNITGGSVSVSALSVTQGTADFVNIKTSGTATFSNKVTLLNDLSGSMDANGNPTTVVHNLSAQNCVFDAGLY
jgi:hypothetical protein